MEKPTDETSSGTSHSRRAESEHVTWLEGAELFRSLKPVALQRIARVTQEVTFDAGAPIFRHGDPGDKLWLLLEGKVRIARDLHGLGEETLAILSAGQMFGEMALLDESPRSADAWAHTS